MDDWKPIETAPHDRTWFLARTAWGAMRFVHFADDCDRYPISHDGECWPTPPIEWCAVNIPDLVADLRRVTAERDKWFEGAGAHHVASMQQSQRADRAEVALAAVEQRIKLLCDNDEWNLGLHEALDLVKAEREAGKTQIEGLSADNERVRQANYALVQSCEQHRTRAEAAKAEVARLTEALIWCSGSNDFQEGGKARDGWLKLCAPLINGGKTDD